MCWGMYVCTCGCVHMCLLKRAKKHPHMFRCAQGGCAVISIQFYGVPFCKQPPPPPFKMGYGRFLPSHRLSLSVEFPFLSPMAHYEPVRPKRGNVLYISAWLPSQPHCQCFPIRSLFPFPCPGARCARSRTCFSQSCSRKHPGPQCWSHAGKAARGRRRERRGRFPSQRRCIPEGAGSQRLFGHIKQSSCVGFHMSGVPGSMTYGLI